MDPGTAFALANLGFQAFNSFSSARQASQGQAAANEQNMQLMDYANNLNVSNYKHRHQWEVEDLKAAGLNPILSANGGGAVPGSSPVTMQNTEKESSLIRSTTAKMLSEIALNREQAKTERTKQGVNDAQADQLRGTVDILGTRVPLSTVADAVKSVGNKVNSAKSVIRNIVDTTKRKAIGVARSGAIGLNA